MNSQSQTFGLPGSAYGYTGTPIDDLQSFEWTMATGLLDESGSTRPFAQDMEMCVVEVVKSLRLSPREANLLYRHCHFGTNFREVHGFKPLGEINPDDYKGCYQSGGQTALYHSCKNVIDAMTDYGRQLVAKRYMVNGIVYMITDGQHYLEYDPHPVTMQDVKTSLVAANSAEVMESLMTILIGVNKDPGIQKMLREFSDFCGFTQYVPMDEANAKTLAKLANFISKSVQAQSQSLGSGQMSQPQSMTF